MLKAEIFFFIIRCFYPRHLFSNFLNSKNVMLRKVQSASKSLGMNKPIWRNDRPLVFWMKGMILQVPWEVIRVGWVLAAGTCGTCTICNTACNRRHRCHSNVPNIQLNIPDLSAFLLDKLLQVCASSSLCSENKVLLHQWMLLSCTVRVASVFVSVFCSFRSSFLE